MTTFNEHVRKYTIKPSNKIKRICDPLRTIYNFKFFWYKRTTEHGRLFTISNNPDFHDFYYSSRMFLTNPFYRNPKLIQPGFHYLSGVRNKEFQSNLNEVTLKFNVEGGLFAFHHKGVLHTFGYANDLSDQISLKEIITDNSDLLKKFNEYFLKELHNNIKIDCDDFIDLRKEMGDHYNKVDTGLRSKLGPTEKCSFLDSLGLIDQEDVYRLTPRELDCLKCLHMGFKAPETASMLNLSKRSVEKYIELIKNKLNCHTKRELFEKAKCLHLSNFF